MGFPDRRVSSARDWICAAFVGVAVVLLVSALFRAPVAPSLVNERRSPKIVLRNAGTADAALTEQAIIRDNAPLFLPTRWNAPRPASVPREPGRVLLATEPLQARFSSTDLGLHKQLAPNVTLNGVPMAGASPVDALDSEPTANALVGFGREVVQLPAAAARTAVIEVYATRTGERVALHAVPPAVMGESQKPWGRMTLLMAVAAQGGVGRPTVTESSRLDEVDQFFVRYLSESAFIGDIAAPGFYRIVITP